MRSKESCNSSCDRAHFELGVIDAVVGVAKPAALPQMRKWLYKAPAWITVLIITPHYHDGNIGLIWSV
jgi:hypothetical protein